MNNPYEEGWDAFMLIDDFVSNPYEEDTFEYAEWQNGWFDAYEFEYGPLGEE